ARILNRPTGYTPRPIRVLPVSRRRWLAEALAVVLRADPSFAVLEVQHDPLPAAAQAHRTRPDVTLVDCLWDGVTTSAIIEMLETSLPGSKMLLLMAWADDATVARYARAGAAGCVTGSWSSAELIDAIKRVHAGEVLFSPGIPVSLLGRPHPCTTGAELTPRERAVLR